MYNYQQILHFHSTINPLARVSCAIKSTVNKSKITDCDQKISDRGVTPNLTLSLTGQYLTVATNSQ